MQNQIQESLESQDQMKKVASELQKSSYILMALGYRDKHDTLFEQGVLISLILHYLGLEAETDEEMIEIMKELNIGITDQVDLCDRMIAVSETLENNINELVKIPA